MVSEMAKAAPYGAHKIQSPLLKEKGMHPVLMSFLFALGVTAAIFVPFLIVDKGFFLYCGDYNSQQIPFYYYLQGFIREGGGTWSWATDLGSSAINSYSFYNLGSPFFWLTLLFPATWLPFMMVPLFMLKFGAIAAATCLYLQRYAKTRNMAVICSLIYTFCGFNVYNIFFNHMLEPVAIFSMMLWALDGYMYERKRGWFALFVGLALINNYFFFVGNVVFVLIYLFIRLATGEFKIGIGDFGLLGLEAVIGVGLGMVLALPSFYDLIQNPRVDNFANGLGMVLYGNVQQYANILTSLFLPPDPPYLPNLFTEGVIKWTSMTAFLPIVGMAGVFAYFRARRGTALKITLAVCFVMALVPILNSSFYAFNSSYYARWYYMPLLMAAMATMHSLEDCDIDLARGNRLVLIFTALFAVFALLPTKVDDGWAIGVVKEQPLFWLTWLQAMAAAGCLWLLLRYGRNKARFAPLLLAAVMGFSVLYSVVHISRGKFEQWERDATYREQQYDGSLVLDLPDDQFYRIDTFGCFDNLGLWLNKSNLYTFNSTVSPSIMEFYPFVGVKRDVSSKPETDYYALRGLLSSRYAIMPTGEQDRFLMSEGVEGWTFWKEEGPFAVYENQNFVPLGFTYNYYVSMDALEEMTADNRGPMLMRAIGLTSEQAEEYAHLFESEASIWQEEMTNGAIAYVPRQFGYPSYVQDCKDRRASASYATHADASGFSVNILLEKENLVFFSVPYDAGFTATVNGVEAEILKVSSGMMAVLAPAGDCEIVFSYQTPGFRHGVLLTLLSLALLALYLLACRAWARRKARLVKAAVPAMAAGEADGHTDTVTDIPAVEEDMPPNTPAEEDAAPEDASDEGDKDPWI